MGKKFLMDTNVISHLFANKLSDTGRQFVSDIVNDDFIISVVCLVRK